MEGEEANSYHPCGMGRPQPSYQPPACRVRADSGLHLGSPGRDSRPNPRTARMRHCASSRSARGALSGTSRAIGQAAVHVLSAEASAGFPTSLANHLSDFLLLSLTFALSRGLHRRYRRQSTNHASSMYMNTLFSKNHL